jgi:hypothetical protein
MSADVRHHIGLVSRHFNMSVELSLACSALLVKGDDFLPHTESAPVDMDRLKLGRRLNIM